MRTRFEDKRINSVQTAHFFGLPPEKQARYSVIEKIVMNRLFPFTAALLVLLMNSTARCQDNYQPKIADASKDAELALKGFRLPENVQGSLLAAEPMLANPVCFTITNDGRIIVCETFRQEVGVEDNRNHMNRLENDLQLESVEERAAMFRKYMDVDVQKWAVEHDRLRMLEDTNGDGTLDRDTLFADGFNDIVDGTGAGVIEHNGRIYYTCIPNLWSFADKNNDGVAEDSKMLHHGYGVRVAFRGHDMHGLVVGPDGRIYFSIGDRGYNVITKEGTRLKRVDTGAVFRCDADGSHLEVFAYGLRNPQELAFDDNGNLFTGDNNSDSGDKARWVYVVQDGDTGWRMYYQYLDDRAFQKDIGMWLAANHVGPGDCSSNHVLRPQLFNRQSHVLRRTTGPDCHWNSLFMQRFDQFPGSGHVRKIVGD